MRKIRKEVHEMLTREFPELREKQIGRIISKMGDSWEACVEYINGDICFDELSEEIFGY